MADDPNARDPDASDPDASDPDASDLEQTDDRGSADALAIIMSALEDVGISRERAEATFKDDSCPERTCDNCGRLYRGRSVYCSMWCAVSDA
jgi:hypothetical protein